jgi:uncharacterized Fe-S radical SAM superfamily protein PflX
MKNIYLITGQKRAGKDFVGEILSDYLECDTYAFADDMKVILSETFGISIEDFNKLKNEDRALYVTNLDAMGVHYSRMTSFRKIIQNFGESIKNLYNSRFWADRLIIKLIEDDNDNIVITDLRYFVELETIKNYFGADNVKTIKVINRNLEPDSHISEQEMLDYEADVILDNTDHSLKEGDVLEKVLL